MLLPLAVAQGGGAAHVGMVMAMLSLGGLSAPAWGMLADHYRGHRLMLSLGMVGAGVALALFPLTPGPAVRAALALGTGLAATAASTVASLLVVEAHPRAEWDARIGWLQTYYGLGQVGGLLLAGALSALGDVRTGLFVAAGLAGLSGVTGYLTAHTPPGPIGERPVLALPSRSGEWAPGSLLRHAHHVTGRTFGALKPLFGSRYGLFLGVWCLSFTGAASVFALYPVLMQKTFGVAPGLSSAGFAAAAGLGLLLYAPAGGWARRRGHVRVLQGGLALRLLAFAGLVLLGLSHPSGQGALALLAFGLAVLAWSLLSVAGTALAAALTTVGQGESLGIYNAATALAGVAGAALGGFTAAHLGYGTVAGIALVGTVLGLALSTAIPEPQKPPG